MGLKNTWQEYGSVAKWIHWSIFVLIVIMLLSGFYMEDINDKQIRGLFFLTHKATGVLIFFFTLFRIFWALNNRKPKLPSKMFKIEKLMARAMQRALYALLLFMPFTGWMMTSAKGYPISMYGLFNFPLAPIHVQRHAAHFWVEIHELVAWTLIVLVSIHGLAAIKHHFWNKDNVLKMMLPRRKGVVVKTHIKKRLKRYD